MDQSTSAEPLLTAGVWFSRLVGEIPHTWCGAKARSRLLAPRRPPAAADSLHECPPGSLDRPPLDGVLGYLMPRCDRQRPSDSVVSRREDSGENRPA